jgi:ATP-dependent exoDNAse (exonuclease V) alpha subunit
LLLYVGGTGKSQVIRAVELGYELLQRKSEVLLTAPTGAAANHIGGRTVHTALCVDLYDRPRRRINSHAYALWKDKTIMIIDEISMVSLTMLTTINEQCNKIRAIQRDSTAILGAMPIVVFMGDFHQFPPVRAQPLWQTPIGSRAILGQRIWHRFTTVFLLDEQMRQRGDLEFQDLLHRAREGTMTEADVTALNGRLTQSLPLGDGLESVCMTRANQRRHHINRIQIRRFAEARAQDIYVFPAAHSRTKKVRGALKIDELLGTQDGEGSAKGPGLFLYTQGMPVTILYNVCTPLGLVNGAKGIAAGIVPDPNGKPLIF